MHKIKQGLITFLAICSVCFILLFSCTKADIRLQDNIISGQYTQIIEVDTISPVLTTILLDSFRTSGTGGAVVGYYNDPVFGKINASSYFQIESPSFSATATTYNDAVFDSLTLYIKLTPNYYGDTSQPVKFNIYQLAENIYPNFASGLLFNTSRFDTVPGVLNYSSNDAFFIRPNAPAGISDTVSIRLSDDLGKNLLTMLQNQDINIQNVSAFNNFFKGLKIESPNTGATIASFKDSIEMRLYYSVPGVPLFQQKIATFDILNPSYHFNSITTDRTGTPLQDISRENPIPSSSTNNMAFAQSVTGIMTKIGFPTINNVLQNPNFLKITNASLFIRPVIGTYDLGNFTLPQTLRLVQTNATNIIGAGSAALGFVGADLPVSGTSVSQNGSLVMASGIENSYYTFDLTSYLQNVVRNNIPGYNNGYGLVLTTPAQAFDSTFNRLILGDAQNVNGNNRLQLKVFYLTVQ
ncbi:MAG: DUF4270 domain-containing protein [Chitinophagaceae bacterium]|jgi:hypothetical protein|nr:DUF4270 domain-containing protein [Chitinophagaceae bacterium]